MGRGKRSKQPISAATSSGASTLFQYSVAQPPEGFQPPGSPPPPLPIQSQRGPATPIRQTSSDGLLVDTDDEADPDAAYETPLYARSDWTKDDQPPFRSPAPGRQSGYSESEYPPTTALPTKGDGRETPWYARSEVASQYAGGETPTPKAGRASSSPDKQADKEEDEQVPTAWSMSSYAPRGTVLNTLHEEPEDAYGAYEGYYDEVDLDHNHQQPAPGARARDSLRSSVVDISERKNPFSAYDRPPVSAVLSERQGLHHRGPSRDTAMSGAALLTPAAHQRLGRMSVAPARYTLPPGHVRRGSSSGESGDTPRSGGSNPYAPPGGLRFQQNHLPGVDEKGGRRGLARGLSLSAIRPDEGVVAKLKMSNIGQMYRTYRPFITPGLLLTGAMLLTLAIQPGGTLGTFVKVQPGGLGGKVGEGTDGAFGLGVSGWCQLDVDQPICQNYKRGDFKSTTSDVQIPGPDTLQGALSNLTAALLALSWLMAIYHLTTAFLHFFLLFGLSIPWDFFITSDPLPPLTGVPPGTARMPRTDRGISEHEVVQKEVDLRVRCERPPYEAYGWVWWAWWAHRRGPVGHVFGLLVGVVGLCAASIAAAFYMQVKGAVPDGKASLGAGTMVPSLSLILALDPIISAVRYTLHARYNFDCFNAPPSPTPAAVLLPLNMRPMKHVRKTGAGSYFVTPDDAPRAASIFPSDPDAPPLPPLTGNPTPGPLDPETVRWLAAYPLDPDLVALISDLRAGGESDDFVLSDVGLLYLRPSAEEEGGGDALLVPPAGQIRGELVQDAHFELLDQGDTGESAHWGPETMLSKLGETFWWPGIEEDCRELAEGCARCRGDGMDREKEVKPEMTPLPFTGLQTDGAGMTGVGESAMAADMAFAIRKAEDEARRDALGL